MLKIRLFSFSESNPINIKIPFSLLPSFLSVSSHGGDWAWDWFKEVWVLLGAPLLNRCGILAEVLIDLLTLEYTIHLALSFHSLWCVNVLVNMNKYLYLYDKPPIFDYKFLENRQCIVLASPIVLCMSSKCGMNIVYGWSKCSNDRK